jgi:VWFA-related protein
VTIFLPREDENLLSARHSILQRLWIPLIIGSFIYWGSNAWSQKANSKKEPVFDSQSTFRLPVNVVVVNATVTDKTGEPVTDLTAGDFAVYDDGKRQAIQTFALESYGPAGWDEPPDAGSMSKRSEEETMATHPRMISLLIDDLTIESPADLMRMVEGIREYLKGDVGPQDMIAVLSGSGNVQFPFSNDRRQLLEGVTAALRRLNFAQTLRSSCPKLTDINAWRIADAMHDYQVNYQTLVNETMQCLGLDPSVVSSKTTAEIFLRTIAKQQAQIDEYRTRSLLYTLRQHVRALRHFEGPKRLVLFSDGFLSEPGSATAYQLQEIVDLALRSGIVLNTVNIRGLSYEQQDIDDQMAQESPLSQMAYETGGMFFHNDNNFAKGIRTIARRQAYYYVLSYGMPSQKADGSYHKIKLEVTRPGLSISYRKGYYTQKEQLNFENSKKEDILEALTGPGNMNEIPMTLAYNYSVEEDSSYAVSFVTNVDIHRLQFPEEESRRRNIVSLVLVAFDENDRYVNGLEKSIDFRLLEDSYSSLREHGLISRVQFKLPMGRYKVKAVVRENTQGKMGSITKAVEIP